MDSTISINSKHFIDHIDAIIIQLAQIISVERAIPVDPDAITETRKIIATKHYGLMSSEFKEKVSTILSELEDKIRKNNKDQDSIKYYSLIKELLGL